MRRSRISSLSFAFAAILGAASATKGQVLIGGFQGPTDPTDAGWIDLQSSDPIATSPNASFPAAGVPGYPLSLQLTKQGLAAGFANPSSLELQFSPAQVAAFNANSYITFTFSDPTGAATGGYNQIYNIALNAPTYGYNNLVSGGSAATTWGVLAQEQALAGDGIGDNLTGNVPNFYTYAGDPALDSEIVTINYSSVLSAIEAGGESYLQMTFQGNTGGGANPFQDFNDVVLSTAPFGVDAVPEPASIAILGLAAAGLMGRRRRA
jgi:hypothetical protein